LGAVIFQPDLGALEDKKMMFERGRQTLRAEAYALLQGRRNGREVRKKRYNHHTTAIKETLMGLKGFRVPAVKFLAYFSCGSKLNCLVSSGRKKIFGNLFF